MGGCIASGVCCCFGMCCSSCSDALKELIGPERVTKVFYFFLVLVFVIPSIFIFFFLYNWDDFRDFFDEWLTCPNSDDYECIGASAVYRLSLSLLALFVLMMLIMVCRNKCAQVANEGLFCFKYLFVVALFIAFLFVPNSSFDAYAQATKYISILFVLLQSIILIDLFYLAGIRLVSHYDAGEGQYACYLITLTVIAEVIAIFFNVFGYIEFSSTEDGTCSSTVWVNVITSVILILLPVLQFFNFNSQNSLLTTALASLYISYLAFIGQYSFVGDCNRLTTGTLITDIVISTFFFILTMYGSIMGGTGQVKVTQGGDVNKALGVAPTERGQAYEKQKGGVGSAENLNNDKAELKNEEKYTDSWDWVKWHFYMALASVYVAVLITNWNSANVITQDLTPSGFSFWVRVILSWVTTLLYIWTLIAPRVFPQRDFTVV